MESTDNKIQINVEKENEYYMKKALQQAKKALKIGEVPIGCVIVKDGEIIARGYNRRNIEGSVLSHAEINAIRKACRVVGDWRLEGCTMYVTLEPCQMCAGTLVQSRIDRVVIGAMNKKAGCAGSIIDMFHMKEFNHRIETVTGVLMEECSAMMSEFFAEMRKNK